MIEPTPDPGEETIRGGLHIQSLEPPFSRLEFQNRVIAFPTKPARGFCSATETTAVDFPKLFLHRPGLKVDGPYVGLVQPSQKLKLLCGQKTLVAYGLGRDNLGIDIVWRDPSGVPQQMVLPWPTGAEPAWGHGPLGFDEDERALFILGPDLVTRAYFFETRTSQVLGTLYLGAPTRRGELFVDLDGMLWLFDTAKRSMRSLAARLSPSGSIIALDLEHKSAISCDWDGVRRVPLTEDTQPALLDPEPCGGADFDVTPQSSALYFVGNELRQVATTGPSKPIRLAHMMDQQFFALCQDGALAYSLDPTSRFGAGVGNGFLQGRKFMERGRDVRFSPDCRKVYFKEHAATLRRLGQLRSFDRDKPDGEAIVRLAENVGFVHMLADGRLLIQDNLATVGPHNRISLIDPDRLTARTLFSGPIAVLWANQISKTFAEYPEDQVLLEVDTAEITGPRRTMLLSIPPR